MKITILTLFPNMFDGFLNNSIIKRAISKNKVEIKIINIRDYTLDKYNRVDSAPIGGGAGLILKCQPIVDALRNNSTTKTHKIILSPRGKVYDQKKAYELKDKDEILILCGHYEGVDERVNDYFDELISLGDFILTGGEIAAMAISDSVIRLIDGVISSSSLLEESFSNELLEYPQYTEPDDFEGKKVPNILYTGNHTAIAKYHRKESLRLTKMYRPELLSNIRMNKTDQKLLKEIDENDENPKWMKDALEKGKKFTK